VGVVSFFFSVFQHTKDGGQTENLPGARIQKNENENEKQF
jgi:hypothetical protein